MSSGLCECGCGETTAIAPRTNASKGWVKGHPLRFAAPGHNARVTNRPHRVVTSDDWTVEDRGYETPCWIWKHGEGEKHRMVMVGTRRVPAHRVVYEQLVGTIPRGYFLHHKCLIPRCVRPDHMEPLTPSEHGRLHARLRPESAIVVSILESAAPVWMLARDLGVTQGYVRRVLRRAAHAGVTP